MIRTCDTYWEDENAYRIYIGKPEAWASQALVGG